MPDNRRMSDKVPKGMLKPTKELPVKSTKQNRRPAPKRTPSERTPSERTPSERTPPERTPPERTLSERTTPGQTMPKRKMTQRAPSARAQSGQAPRERISPQAQKAAARAMQSKTAPKKRRGRRAGNYILYYLLAAAVVVAVMAVLANTVLFKCAEIEVEGNTRYSASEIISRSGLKTGDNLLHVNTGEAAERIVASLAYIDSATVRRSFPTKLVVTVDEAEKWFALSQNGVTAAISRMGKILEHGAAEGLTVVKGFDAETIETGKWLKSATEGKNDIPKLIFDAVEKSGLKELDEIDMTDKFSVKLSVDGGRVLLELGPATDVESKLHVAAAIIEKELGAEESVTLLLTNPEKVAARNKPKPPSSSSSSSTTSAPPPESSEPSDPGEPSENGDPYEDPGYEDPGYEDPGYEDPGYEDPGYEDPGYEDPGYEDPGYEDPGY